MSSPFLAWRFSTAKDNILLARTGHVVEAHFLGDIDNFLGRFGF
jgi:hypothetical protein